MTAAPPDVFDDAEPLGRGGVKRDGHDRAVLRRVAGDPDSERKYASPSGLAKPLGNASGIAKWRERHLARGFGVRPDLADLAAVETYTTGPYDADREASSESGRRLDALCERAMDAVMMSGAADRGTALHALAENPGMPAPPHLAYHAQGIRDAYASVNVLASELPVVCEELGTFGTLDVAGLVTLPGEDAASLVVVDLKTGTAKPYETEAQVAAYARSVIIDRETHERTTYLEAFGFEMRTDVGLMLHAPAGAAPRWILLDLDRGLASINLANAVLRWRSSAGKESRKPNVVAL